MDEHNAGTDSDKRRHFEQQDRQDQGENNGPDTVRILPDSGQAQDGDGEWYIERPAVRSGTLYTPAPIDQTSPLDEPSKTVHHPAHAQSRQIPLEERRSKTSHLFRRRPLLCTSAKVLRVAPLWALRSRC